jgi:hypothetical protein
MSVEYYKSTSKTSKNNKNLTKFEKTNKIIPIDMKIIEKFQPDTINFETPEDFKEYLSENLEGLKEMTTQKLNKQFCINGYRITKIKGEISLRKIIDSNTNDSEFIDANAIFEMLNNLNTKIDKLISALHQ